MSRSTAERATRGGEQREDIERTFFVAKVEEEEEEN